MKVLLFLCSLFLLVLALPKCFSMYAPVRRGVGNIYLFTEDARLGRFGRLPLQRRGACRNEFLPRRYARGYVSVTRRSGVLSLRKNLRALPIDANGIRKFTTSVLVIRRCFSRRRPNIYVSSRIISRRIVSIKLIIFPVNFGDRLLARYNKARISSKVHESDTSRNTHSASAMLRILRLVTQKIERKAFDEMMSSIKVEKTLEFVINEILAKYVVNTAGNRVFYSWFINSLFSSSALQRLAKECGCKENRVIKCPENAEYRTIDGTCNNIDNPLFGSAPKVLNRVAPARYFDPEGLNDPIGFPGQADVPDIPATFKVVREFIIQQNQPSERNNLQSHMLMQFGQFLDHDLDLSPESQSSDNCENAKCDGSFKDFAVPCFTILPFDRFRCIDFARSASECQIKHGRITTRQQFNINTAFVDASQIYGSTRELAKFLRDLTNDNGLLKTSPGVLGDFLPLDTRELMAPSDFCTDSEPCFLAGDSRSSEQMLLATMHILFVREHNRIARVLRKLNPNWSGEKIYQETRKIVGAVLQKITYEDFVPIIIGNTLPGYQGYDPTVQPDILNSFSTAAFRFGHSLIRPTFDRLDANFNPTGDPLPLRQLFSNNTFIRRNGIDEVVLGLLSNTSQTVDRKIAVGVLNHLYERIRSPGLNLAALNIQRSRDHGLPGYNAFRRFCGLKNAITFRETANEIPNRRNRRLLAKLYKKPELADLWVSGLAEAPVNGGIVGATFACIIREQMRRTRDGDRFFYLKTGVFTPTQLHEIKKATLSKILCDNLKNIVSIQRNAFAAGSSSHRRVECSSIPGIDLTQWKDERDSSHISRY